MQLAMTDKMNEMVDMMWSDVDANAARQMTLILAAGSSNSNRQKMTVDRSSPKYRCRLICKDGQAS